MQLRCKQSFTIFSHKTTQNHKTKIGIWMKNLVKMKGILHDVAYLNVNYCHLQNRKRMATFLA